MTYRIDTSKVKSEINMDFEQIQKDLTKFKNHTSMPQDDVITLMNYIDKFERLIADEDYNELEYSAECFMCNLRDILANVRQEPIKRSLSKCADRMGITVQKTNGVLEVTLPMILPTKSKTKADYLFDPIFYAMESFAKTESLFMKEKAMMCIEFIYDKNNKNIPRGDHDNKEVKQVIDAIAPFVVRDDSDNYLSLCQISSEGDYNHTTMERNGNTYKPVQTPIFSLENIEPDDKEHLYRKQYTCPRGCIGYVRGDFSQNGKEFHSTWFPDDNKLYTEDFRKELDDVINHFRLSSETPLLRSRTDMQNVCVSLKAPKHENCGLTIYALKLETEKHTYYFWCNPSPQDYNFRVMCYDSKKHLRYKDELLTLTHVDRLEDDKIFLNENGVTEMYFNIDAGAGGQVVINEISKDLIRESAKYNKDADDFFEFLGGGCNQYLVDMGTPEFKSAFLEFVNKKADYEGINDKTVKGLKKHAGVDKKKSEPER